MHLHLLIKEPNLNVLEKFLGVEVSWLIMTLQSDVMDLLLHFCWLNTRAIWFPLVKRTYTRAHPASLRLLSAHTCCKRRNLPLTNTLLSPPEQAEILSPRLVSTCCVLLLASKFTQKCWTDLHLNLHTPTLSVCVCLCLAVWIIECVIWGTAGSRTH